MDLQKCAACQEVKSNPNTNLEESDQIRSGDNFTDNAKKFAIYGVGAVAAVGAATVALPLIGFTAGTYIIQPT